MRVLLVTKIDKLSEKLSALNPELDYCAIVTNDVESAKKILESLNLRQEILHPFKELKKCLKTLDYDYAVCLQNIFYGKEAGLFLKCDLANEKILDFAVLHTDGNFQTKKHLEYYREHAQDIEMFTTGTSTAQTSVDIRKFKHQAVNFAASSQDLYYSFQIAKSIVACGKEYGKLRYALIGLTPYSFHYDLSKTKALSWKGRMLPYFIVFGDLHHFPVSADVYRQFFREDWLTKDVSQENVNINGLKSRKVISENVILNGKTNHWIGKYYPETREENIKLLDDYLTLCEENHIRPVMFLSPVSEKYMANFNPRLIEEFYLLVAQAVQKHKRAVFVDGWKLNLTAYADFYDHAHMNVHGAAKFSSHMNQVIEKLEAQEI